MPSFSADIVIIGAGLVGTATAVVMNALGFSSILLEQHIPISDHQSEDSRPLALSYGSYRILDTLKVMDQLAEASPIREVQVSSQGTLGGLHFRARDFGVSALGYVTQFPMLQRALYRMATNAAAITSVSIRNITDIEILSDSVTVTAETETGARCFKGALLIAADGAHSFVRQYLNIKTEMSDHEEVALTALLECASPHQAIAEQRFTEWGVIGLLPLYNLLNYRLVWTMSSSQASEIASWTDDKKKSVLNHIFSDRIAKIINIHWGQNYPVKTVIAKKSIAPPVVLVGNAAQTLYPVAAQGFNLALRDIAILADVLQDARWQGLPLGSPTVLANYGDWRAPDQKRAVRLTECISDLFGLDIPGLNAFRGLGLLGADLFWPIKKRLGQTLMGIAGRVPQLARGIAFDQTN